MNFQTGRSSQKNKVYDVNVSEADQHEHHATADTGHHERAFFTHADEHEVELEPDFIEALIAQDDADALTVSTFEGEFEDFLQETPEMYEALTSYIEARSKLVEKRKSRGFWPVKGKGKTFKGRGKSFGKKVKGSGSAVTAHFKEPLPTLRRLGSLESRVSPGFPSWEVSRAFVLSHCPCCDRWEASRDFPSLDRYRWSDFRRWVWTSVCWRQFAPSCCRRIMFCLKPWKSCSRGCQVEP